MFGSIRLAARLAAAALVAAAGPPICPAAWSQAVPGEAVSPFRLVEFRDLPGWPGGDVALALEPFLGTCEGLRNWGEERPLGGAGEVARLAGRAAAFAGACAEAASLADELRRREAAAPAGGDGGTAEDGRRLVRVFFERRFRAFAAGTGLMTGYYEPELRGAEYPVGAFQVPLHAPPPPAAAAPVAEAVGPLPEAMPDRAAIEAGALDGGGLEVAWVDDPVDAFFLHVQGSGRIGLHDGRVLRVGYAGRNGHPYRAIGRPLLDSGAIPPERMSMGAIRAWLAAAAPGEAAALLRHNPSYVFFRVLEGLPPERGPPGALGVPLTPGRSLAVDPAFIPYGAPVFVETRDPVDGAPIRRLLQAQDTGGAIRGPARGDLFWGWGERAAERAGAMREAAEVFVLVPRDPAPGGEDGAPRLSEPAAAP